MTIAHKFRLVCNRYNVYAPEYGLNFELFLLQKVMMIARGMSKENPETFLSSCLKNPIDYLYEQSLALDRDVVEIDIVSNCFNDKDRIHFGCKYKGHWFFISHSAGMYSKRLLPSQYKIHKRVSDSNSYLVSYANIMPNRVHASVGTINKQVLDDYIKDFL